MNQEAALLALIADLYAQIGAYREQVAVLRKELDKTDD